MSDRPGPTERYDGTLTVRILREKQKTVRLQCSSYDEAIQTVKQHREVATAIKIENRDREVVFDSARMDIDDWTTEWKKAKRRFSADVEAHDCPYDNIACVADDLCTQCQIDRVQNRA